MTPHIFLSYVFLFEWFPVARKIPHLLKTKRSKSSLWIRKLTQRLWMSLRFVRSSCHSNRNRFEISGPTRKKVPRAFTETPAGRPHLFEYAPDVSPASLLVAIAIKLEDGGPVFYRQWRWGDSERSSWFSKFRTMIPDSDKKFGLRQAKENDQRITRVGRILRGCGMDELPQIINILRGEMSFVGPRL